MRLIFPIALLFEGKPTFPPDLLVHLAVSPQVRSISVGFRLSKENGPNNIPQIFPIPFALFYIIYDIFLGLTISTRLSKEPHGRCCHKSTLGSPEWLLSETELRCGVTMFRVAELLLLKNQILPLQGAHGVLGNARHTYLGVIPWLLLSHAV